MTTNVTPEKLAPYLWLVHAHHGLPPFYPDSQGRILKDDIELSSEQFARKEQLMPDWESLPAEFLKPHGDPSWEALPGISTGRDHSVDKKFFLALAAKIIDELKTPDA